MVRVFGLVVLMTSQVAWAEQDPTAPLGWMTPSQTQAVPVQKKTVKHRLPTLQGIVCKDKLPCYTVLNDEILSQGETIQGYRVKEINSEYVTLQRNSKHWKLEMFSLDIKNN
ncbi:MSHA biogenesis protein MshK [Vibrio sp. 99-70-13A1]|uniref:MSHA biogenesis protein MshK n=1 Tax=Vibrio sp. 99-70-13A1 TaxID=2607601 RepID=UPI0014935C28|nr:MSHA biogenesis protein MshK [Vibrio sp. 99-70-13A1]